MTESKRLLRVFLCHASDDKPAVKELYDRLSKDGVDPWIDKEKLIPGQDWQHEINRAVRDSDAVIICLSSRSVTKEGFLQKEIKIAFDVAEEKPDGIIFIIPAKLEDCVVPERMRKYQRADLYASDGYESLLKALHLRAESLGIKIRRKRTTVRKTDHLGTGNIVSIRDYLVQAEIDSKSQKHLISKSVYLSYHSSDKNRLAVEDLLGLCLSAIGCKVSKVVSGSTLSGIHVHESPLVSTEKLISSCDMVIAIATPDDIDKKPSRFVMHEVAYAHATGKIVYLFVEKNTNIPVPWRASFIYTEFDITKPGALVRDVINTIVKDN